tara:strand:+ start:511 stop:1077 length:567 start_codon:yes stop_codon:yes gene_type:complete
MRNTLLLIFTISSFVFAEIKYESVHDETYWFPNEEFTLDGFQIGTVRSNLVWMDRMSVFLNESDCSGTPSLYMTLSTSEVRNKYPDFEFSSIENKFLNLEFTYDGKLTETYEVQIGSAFELQNKDHAVSIIFTEMPNPFWMIWEILEVKILETDPKRLLFDLPERQYRMGGFFPLLLHLIEKCDEVNK